MNTKRLGIMATLIAAVGSTGCATIINQGEVGVRDTFGALSDSPSGPGLKMFLWPIWDISSVPVRTVNIEVAANLPSREGLTIGAVCSILYRIDPDSAPKVLGEIGSDYEEAVILPVFRSVIADVSARYDAKDMHTKRRAEIEAEVRKTMMGLVGERGFVIEAVLLKSVRLPRDLSRSIEARMQAEQDAARMKFVLDRERQEAERLIIQASGKRDAQKILSEGITDDLLELRKIEAFEALSKSSNAKVIITPNEKTPVILETE